MNATYALNLSLFVKPEGPTIKKHELNRLIGHLPDDADIYLFTKVDCANRAAQISAEVGTNVLSFSLTGDVIEETHGVSLVARAAG